MISCFSASCSSDLDSFLCPSYRCSAASVFNLASGPVGSVKGGWKLCHQGFTGAFVGFNIAGAE